MSTQPPTPAEAAVARELSRIYNRRDDIPIELEPEDFADESRAVVAAVEPRLTIAALERTVAAIEQFAAHKRKAGHVRDAVGIDEAAELVLDELRAARQSLSRPTSEEHQ